MVVAGQKIYRLLGQQAGSVTLYVTAMADDRHSVLFFYFHSPFSFSLCRSSILYPYFMRDERINNASLFLCCVCDGYATERSRKKRERPVHYGNRPVSMVRQIERCGSRRAGHFSITLLVDQSPRKYHSSFSGYRHHHINISFFDPIDPIHPSS